jgi:hypothetical protein
MNSVLLKLNLLRKMNFVWLKLHLHHRKYWVLTYWKRLFHRHHHRLRVPSAELR